MKTLKNSSTPCSTFACPTWEPLH